MVASGLRAICVCGAFGQRLVIGPCPLSYITLAGQSFQSFLKQGVSCGSGWRPTGSSGVTAGMGAWGAGIRFPPRDGTGHRASQGPGLRFALLPSEPHIFHRKVEGHWLGVRSVRACPGSFPTRCWKQTRSRGSGELAHFLFARVARGGGPESKLPRETWGWASDSGSNGRLRVKDQDPQWEVRGAGPSCDHTQVSWGQVGADVLGWGHLLQLTLVAGGPWGRLSPKLVVLVPRPGHPLGLQMPLVVLQACRAGLSAEAKAPALIQLWPVQAWVGKNLSPITSCFLATPSQTKPL